MSDELAGRLAVVTGGASGIGEACAARLAEDGATVVVADLNLAAATAVADRIGGRAVEVDLAADFDAAALAGQADVLVNCAGLQHVAPVHEFPPEKFRLLLAVMLEAPFRLAQAALPHMYDRRTSAGSSTSPRCTACGPRPTRPPTSRPSTAWRGCPR